MHFNCAAQRYGLVDECIQKLLADDTADSVVSGYIDRTVHPFRTRRVSQEGILEGWLEIPAEISSNRQNLDPCFILDGAARAASVNMLSPIKFTSVKLFGRSCIANRNTAGGDVHSIEDIIVAEYQLRQLGWEPAVPGIEKGPLPPQQSRLQRFLLKIAN